MSWAPGQGNVPSHTHTAADLPPSHVLESWYGVISPSGGQQTASPLAGTCAKDHKELITLIQCEFVLCNSLLLTDKCYRNMMAFPEALIGHYWG